MTMSNPTPTKTPLFQAMHAGRYARQELIRSIEKLTGTELLCYVAGQNAAIDLDDILGFKDLLHNVQAGSAIDLLLQTPGGDIDSAEKILAVIREAAKANRFRVIVPDYAKSAGTLIVLGADAVVMSDTSELGPLDPQYMAKDARGNELPHSVVHYIAAYEEHALALRANPNDPVARLMLEKLSPETLKLLQSERDRAIACAGGALSTGMFRTHPERNFSEKAYRLVDINQYRTHRQRIGWEEARNGLLLEVDYRDPRSNEWMLYWDLYARQRLALKHEEKLFESAHVCLPISSSGMRDESES